MRLASFSIAEIFPSPTQDRIAQTALLITHMRRGGFLYDTLEETVEFTKGFFATYNEIANAGQ